MVQGADYRVKMIMETLTIGMLARRAGVGVETVRFWERRGLVLRPPRPAGGYRTYPEETIARIRFIRQAQALGFTLQEIAALLALRVAPGVDCAAIRARAAAKLADAKTRLAELERICAALSILVAACPGSGAVVHCTILDALSTAAEPVAKARGARVAKRIHGAKDVKSIELDIEGMHCDGCASTVQALLAAETGVKAATVSFAARKGRILYDPAATDHARLTAVIERAGFRVTRDPRAGVS